MSKTSFFFTRFASGSSAPFVAVVEDMVRASYCTCAVMNNEGEYSIYELKYATSVIAGSRVVARCQWKEGELLILKIEKGFGIWICLSVPSQTTDMVRDTLGKDKT